MSNLPNNIATYHNQIRAELNRAISAMDCPSNKSKKSITPQGYPIYPIVELIPAINTKNTSNDGISEMQTQTTCIKHNSKEQCWIESSPNSVRCSLTLKQQQHQANNASDFLEHTICTKYVQFFQYHAEKYHVLRRKPVNGFTISFLILNTHRERFGKEEILHMILSFLQAFDRECSQVKISINARARSIASDFFKAF